MADCARTLAPQQIQRSAGLAKILIYARRRMAQNCNVSTKEMLPEMNQLAPKTLFGNPQLSARRERSRFNRLAKVKTFARCRPLGTAPVQVGYARVSTGGQELGIQLAQLRHAGCTQFFCEKESGIKDDRRQFDRLLSAIRPGDVVFITALDRLTRGGPYKMLSVLQ